MLAFSIDYYGVLFRATQSVGLFCTYFDTGIQQTIQWYLDNEEWWKNILSGEYSKYFEKMYGGRLK